MTALTLPGHLAARLAEDFAVEPFWRIDAALPVPIEAPPPAKVDVLIIGGGYTGLCAARATAAAGRSTLVLDDAEIGSGCSSRNGGQVALSVKPTLAAIAAKHGANVAARIYREGLDAVARLRALARDEALDCDWRDVGCFFGAQSRRHFGLIEREANDQPPGLEQRVIVVPHSRQTEEIDSPLYHGGVVYLDDAAVHPGRLVNALHRRTLDAGVVLRGRCAVRALRRARIGFEVSTARGIVHARQVLIATNGYTGVVSPWHRRRIIPIGSYMVATELLDPGLVRRLIPNLRNIVDTRRVVVYVRPSPDGRRILFGGRASAGETDVMRCVPRMQRMMASMFPGLGNVRISRAWMGFVAYTFDALAHLGEDDGLYYCMGYCGSGIASATYYGHLIGCRMAGSGGVSALEGLEFPTRPYYTGRPWFLRAAVLGYRIRDAMNR